MFMIFCLLILLKIAVVKREKTASLGNRFFPFRVDPVSEGNKLHFDRVVSIESVSVLL